MIEDMSKIKLKILNLEPEEVFELGKDGVRSIGIHEKAGIIEIKFEKDSEWDGKIIPLQNVEILDYKIKV